jgi:glutamyl-tRNA reductase
MKGLALIGVSHRRGGMQALSAYNEAYAAQGVAERLRRAGVRAFVEIATCNRIDVLLSNPEQLPMASLRAALDVPQAARRPYVYSGEGAFEQLARIAASIDSMNPGEDQIMRQVRDAAQAARVRGDVDAPLSFALDAALRIARRVRREVALAPRDTSLFSLVRPEVARLIGARGGSLRALVIGAGEMARLSAILLMGLGGVELTIANRTRARAEALAREVGGEGMGLDELVRQPPSVDLVVSAIPAGESLRFAWLTQLPDLAMVVDLAMPSAIDGARVRPLGVRFVDIAVLEGMGWERRRELEDRLQEAERVLQSALQEEMNEWAQRSLSPSIVHLQALYQAALSDVLPAAEARTLARRLANIPVRGLRALARDHGVEAVRTFAAESGLVVPIGCES